MMIIQRFYHARDHSSLPHEARWEALPEPQFTVLLRDYNGNYVESLGEQSGRQYLYSRMRRLENDLKDLRDFLAYATPETKYFKHEEPKYDPEEYEYEED